MTVVICSTVNVSGNASDERRTSSHSSGEKGVSAASFRARTLFRWAAKPNVRDSFKNAVLSTRDPNAPLMVRQQLQAPVTTARSFSGDVAWAATRGIINDQISPKPIFV